jgi:hypothetical protein
LAFVSLAACSSADNGEGFVEGRFRVAECRPSGDFVEQDFRYDAGFLGTMRFLNTLTLSILHHAVELEETDGLLIRLGDVQSLRESSERPIIRAVSRESTDVNVTLSLFETCPDRPTLVASQGQIEFTDFAVAVDPEDTGVEEVVAGTLTATIVAADGVTIAGHVHSEFNYRPEVLAVTEPR